MAEDKLVFEVAALDKASAVFRQVEGAAKTLQKQYHALQGTFAAVGAGLLLRQIVAETLEWERASTRLDAVLRATGGASGIARHELDQLAVSIARNTEFTNNQVMSAQGNLLKFGSIHEDVFRRALKVSADFASFTGTDMASAAQALGGALADPVQGVRTLQKEFRLLNFTQREYIEQLLAEGNVEQAQIRILELLEKRIGGTAQAMNTGLVGAVSDVKKGWQELMEAIGRSERFQRAAGGLGWLFKDIASGITEETTTGDTGLDAELALGAKNAAVLARQAAAVDRIREAWARATPVLESWRRKLGETTNEMQALALVSRGEGRTLPEGARSELLNIGVELDRRARLAETLKASAVTLELVVDAYDAGDEAQRQFVLSGRDLQAQLEFEIDLIGRTTEEQERLTAARAIDRAAQQAILAGGRPEDILREAERQKLAILEGLRARREAERSWLAGTRNAFNEYINHATNAAEQASMLFTNAFRNMEDALVDFVMTGKLNFRGFAESVIADIIRIQARQAIASGAAAFFGSLFGAGVSASAIEAHEGGVVGDPHPTRRVPYEFFVGAPRLHAGLAADEFPAILQRGERVIPAGAGAGVSIIQHFQIGGAVTQRDLAATREAARQGALQAFAEERRRFPTGPFGR